ncbi:MAG: acyl-CoA dehydrogenase family protein [Myxococcota bacterium]
MTAPVTLEDLFETVDKLAPLLRQHADDAERDRRLAPPVLQALRDAGLFRMFRPRTRGGLELDPTSEYRVAEAVARVDSAAAWNLQVANASELFGGWFPDDANDRVFGAPEAIVAGAFNPHRRAEPVDGGYRVSGRVPFNSGCHGATWLIGLADVHDGDTPRVDADGRPETLLTAIPADECRIVENWNTLGMRGTGSHDVEVGDVFVPRERAVPFGPLEEPSPAYATPLTPLAIWATVGCHATVALGAAQAAVDELTGLGARVPAYTERALRDRSVVQMRLARAEGLLAAARAFFHQAYDEAWAAVQVRGRLAMGEKARCQLASTNVVLAAAEAVDLVHACVGSAGIRQEQRFERHFRDIHVMTQHAFIGEARLEAVGRIMLGLEPDWGFFQF